MIVQSLEWKWCGMLTFVNDCCGCLKLGVTFLQPGTGAMRFAPNALFGLRRSRPLIAEASPVAWTRLVPRERLIVSPEGWADFRPEYPQPCHPLPVRIMPVEGP